MPKSQHRFPLTQERFLRAMKDGSYESGGARHRQGVRAMSLVGKMPPVYQQALRGTCVANAVVALLEYFGDCRTRLSVQFLYAATKEIEREGMERNLANLYAGRALDAGFESVFHAELMQLRMLAGANGGMEAAAVHPYYMRFVDGARARFAAAAGCLLMSSFRAVETHGVCRHALWPYSAAPSCGVFGNDGEAVHFPPGSREDAAKRCVRHGLYLLGTPNNVDEIRGILSGANGRRAMPVAVTVDFFDGCDGETYAMPQTEEDGDGRLVSKNAWLGRHGLLIVGYADNATFPGGGYFIIRNSLGEGWGNRGYGKLPYAYLECFAFEAGTILQDLVDYEGDGYDGQRVFESPESAGRKSRKSRWIVNLAVAAVLVGGTIAVGILFDDPFGIKRIVSREPAALAAPDSKPEHQTPDTRHPTPDTQYKIFFSCENAGERAALRNALSNEDVPFAVEFLPKTLETVLAVRVTLEDENVIDAIARELKEHYDGPRKERWIDVAALVASRVVYIVKADLRRWNE